MDFKDWAIPAASGLIAVGMTMATVTASASDTEDLADRVREIEVKQAGEESTTARTLGEHHPKAGRTARPERRKYRGRLSGDRRGVLTIAICSRQQPIHRPSGQTKSGIPA